MTDDVSFDPRGHRGYGKQRPRKRGPNLLFLLIVGFLAFTLFQRFRARRVPTDDRGQAGPVQDSGELGRPPYRFENSAETPRADQRGGNSDWSMEEVDVKKPNQRSTGSNAKKTTEGDWTLEEVDVE